MKQNVMEDFRPYLAPHHRQQLEIESGIPAALIKASGLYTATDPKQLRAIEYPDYQANVPALVFPMPGTNCAPVLHQIRPDNPRVVDGKIIKYETPAGAKMRLYIHPLIREELKDPGKPLVITEGIKKTLALIARGHCAVGLLGVWNFCGANEYGGVTELDEWNEIAWNTSKKARDVYIIYDSDVTDKEPVRMALIKLAAMIKRRHGRPLPIRIPLDQIAGKFKPEDKIGVDDYFALQGSGDALFAAVDFDLIRTDSINTANRRLEEIRAEAIAAIVKANEPPTVFVRDSELVRIVAANEDELYKIDAFSIASLRSKLADVSGWHVPKTKGKAYTFPPRDVAEDLLACKDWTNIPPLLSIARAPVLARDGTISCEPGYHPGTRTFVHISARVPEFEGDPIAFLYRQLFESFPFVGEADLAHAYALLLLPMIRPIIDDLTPIHVFDAPVQKTGKSLLARLCLMPTQFEVITTGETKDEEEWRKRLMASIRDGKPYVFWDNMTGKIDSGILAKIVMSRLHEDRGMHTMSNLLVTVRQIWVLTANNVQLGPDILTRAIRVRLDSGVEHPEDRGGFRDIEDYIRKNRLLVMSALVKIVRAWADAGMPEWTGRRLGGFEEWSRKMGGLLQHAGIAGFLENVEEMRAASNPEEEAWGAFYQRWYDWAKDRFKTSSTSDILHLFTQDDLLCSLLGDREGAPQRMALGKLLRKRDAQVAGGYSVRQTKTGRGGVSLFEITPASGTAIKLFVAPEGTKIRI